MKVFCIQQQNIISILGNMIGTCTVMCPTSCKWRFSTEAKMSAAGTEVRGCLAVKGYLSCCLTQKVKEMSQL